MSHIQTCPSNADIPAITLVADIGGSWLKLARFEAGGTAPSATLIRANPCKSGQPQALLSELCRGLTGLAHGGTPIGVGISTAGVVDYAGRTVTAGHAYLNPLKTPAFLVGLEQAFACPAAMINDADAALIGAAQSGYFTGDGCFGLLAVGTGCGFTLWKNGHRWRPDRHLPLLGSLRTQGGSFDEVCSAAGLAASAGEDRLDRVFSRAANYDVLDKYLDNLARLIDNAALIYHCESVLVVGGLVAAALAANYDLASALAPRLMASTDYHRRPLVRVAAEGNGLPLLGARALIEGEASIVGFHHSAELGKLPTEAVADPTLRLESCTAAELIEHCLRNENSVAERWNQQAAALTTCATRLAEAFQAGGRLIYIGCGTSGRLAALDALELNCTYGLPKHQVVALVSGGVAEAAASIEGNREEDASAVPELLLLKPSPNDVVIGISASGSAWYVRSGLAYARRCGSFAVLVSATEGESEISDLHIGLDTGPELVTGSTRMKAGTATKKILNAISTTAAIRCGKVIGTEMVEVACLNDKLFERACSILQRLHGLTREQALAHLHQHKFQLSNALRALATQAAPLAASM